MSVTLEQRIRHQLQAARQEGLYRDPPVLDKKLGQFAFLGNQKVLNFASNDYLGLGSSDQAASMVSDAFKRFGSSSSSSRLVTGSFLTTCEAEQAYADYFGYDEALFFPSGYQANLAVISTLFEPEDTLVFDKHVHASCVAGLTMSQAALKGYNHSSMDHLEKRLEKLEDKTAVVTESLFSMDGDLLDVEKLAAIKKEHSFFCIVDEAHAFGVLGDKGRGIARPVADIALGTFGKAFGLFGAFVLMPKGFKAYLTNFASPFIYTTALPEAHGAAALKILEIVSKSDHQRAHLGQISSFMKDQLIKQGFLADGDAHILSIAIGNEDVATKLSKALLKEDILAFPARYPTVQKGKAILRVSMSALHQQEDVQYFVKTLKKVSQNVS
ncbi:MAG: aminotransferase class I/II-fold pyridoxal phosphate-dependent enzyme [Pseudomonadota bacterium]